MIHTVLFQIFIIHFIQQVYSKKRLLSRNYHCIFINLQVSNTFKMIIIIHLLQYILAKILEINDFLSYQFINSHSIKIIRITFYFFILMTMNFYLYQIYCCHFFTHHYYALNVVYINYLLQLIISANTKYTLLFRLIHQHTY